MGDSATCAPVVAAYNAGLAPADSSARIAAAYVLSVANAYVLTAPVGKEAAQRYYYYDSNYKLLAVLTAAR